MEALIPLTDVERPPFPTHALPDPLRSFAEAVAVSLQVPDDLPALLGLATVAAACARRVVVRAAPTWPDCGMSFTAIPKAFIVDEPPCNSFRP